MKLLTLLALTFASFTLALGESFDLQSARTTHTNLISSNPNSVVIDYDLSDVALQTIELDGTTLDQYVLEAEGTLLQDGMPKLPSIGRFVVIPPKSAVELVVTEDSSPRRIRATNPPLLTNDESLGEATIRPGDDGIYPPHMAELSDPVIVRGVRMVQVTIYPIQYDFNTGTYIHHQNLQAEVRECDGEVINPVENPIVGGYSQDFLTMISMMAINGHEVGRDDPERDALPRYNGHYLVVVHESLLRYAAPFIEWRRKAGYKVDIFSVPSNQASNAAGILTGIRDRYLAYRNNGQAPFEYMLAIGDRASYLEMGDQQVVLESPQGAGTFGAPHGDWLYGCLDGNDEVPDIATGRWPGGTANLVGLMVGRTLAYEATPNMDDPDWFTRGGAVSQHWGNGAEAAYHVTNPSMVRWAANILKDQGYTDIRHHENLNWDQYGRESGPVFEALLNTGANAVLARSENYFWCTRNPSRNYFDQDIEDNTMFPFRLNASGHGEWSAEMEFRTGAANHLKGWVALTNSWNGPQTEVSTSLWSDEVQAVMLKKLPLGWAYSYAEGHLQVNLPNGPLSVGRTDHNFFGDPGLRAWRGVPRVVEMEAPESIAPTTRLVEVFVHLPESDTPVPDARVSFYAPGNLPAFDHASYAGYNRMWVKNTVTDAEGIARIVLDPTDTLFIRTNLYVTVTGEDIAPCFRQAAIEAQDANVEVGAIDYEEIQGNGDARLNPGETFNVLLAAKNTGDAVAPAVSARITSQSPYIEIVGDNVIDFGDIASGEANDGNIPVAFDILSTCPDASVRPMVKPSILVEFTSDESSWRSAFNLDVWAPHLEFRSVVGGPEVPDEAFEMNVEIANIGRINSGEIGVQLRSAGQGVTVVDGSSTFPAIGAGRTARLDGGSFELSGNKVVVPGSTSELYMIFSTENGFIDTSYFTVQIMHPRALAPIGPDKYGYICFDDTDTLWDIAPVYDWEEINPDDNQSEFDGTRLQFQGQSARDLGEAIVIPLGFTTQYYGIDYDTITVATNGFIAMGAHPRMTNHHNYPLNTGIGGVGLIAPFWDDLRFNQNTRIFVYPDREDSRFIVEWYKMRPASGEAEQTFQVILYDKRVWITESGDPNILIQYKTINNLQNVRANDNAGTTNNAYASAGINSPYGDTGIDYTSNNRYPPGAAALAAGRALLFTTSVRFRAGILYGMVTDHATGAGIPGATVYTKHGFIATTDDGGYWRIAEALADILFDITAHQQGYNDSTYLADVDSLVVPEGDSLEINFDLLHPEFSPTTYILADRLDPGRAIDLAFSLTNTGNGPMDWTAEKRLLGDANAAPWELRRAYNVSQTVDDERLEGVVFADNRFFVSGANDNEENLIYILDREGALTDSFYQVGSSRYGYKDMDWDGEFIWAAGEDSIYAFTVAGEIAYRWEDPLRNPNQFVACNRDEGIIYLCGTTSDIYRFDREGNRLDGDINNLDLRQYGMTYWSDDPDGHCLYIVNRPFTNNHLSRITKMNIETGDTMTVAVIEQDSSSTGQMSAFITNEFDVYSWVFMSMQNIAGNGGGDRLEIHQVDARKDWMDLDVLFGRLETGETQEFVMSLNSSGLPDTLFLGEILFTHNADSGIAHIGISLEVIGPELQSPFDLLLPANGDTLTALPLHGDTLRLPERVFVWNRSIDANFADSIVTYVQYISTGARTVSFALSDTVNRINLDTLELSLWFDTPVTWWVESVSGEDVVESTARFTLNIIPNSLDQVEPIPVEFGLAPPYPNPFNGRTAIRFGADLSERTTLIVYDLAGREMVRLFDGVPRVGYHTITWNADQIPTGVYVLRLQSAGRTRVAKLALIK